MRYTVILLAMFLAGCTGIVEECFAPALKKPKNQTCNVVQHGCGHHITWEQR
jgi:hypothetical protein